MMNTEEVFRRMIDDLRKQVVEKVPQQGAFDVVYEEYKAEKGDHGFSNIFLKVSPVKLKDMNERFLELALLNYPSPYGAETVVGFGTTQDILQRLADPELLTKLQEDFQRLMKDLEDV